MYLNTFQSIWPQVWSTYIQFEAELNRNTLIHSIVIYIYSECTLSNATCGIDTNIHCLLILKVQLFFDAVHIVYIQVQGNE